MFEDDRSDRQCFEADDLSLLLGQYEGTMGEGTHYMSPLKRSKKKRGNIFSDETIGPMERFNKNIFY